MRSSEFDSDLSCVYTDCKMNNNFFKSIRFVIFQKGDVLRVNRGFYYHFGVYVGNYEVVHFTGGTHGELDPGKAKITKTSLKDFEKSGTAEVCNRKISERYNPSVIAERAIGQVGSKFGGYNLVGNNCEHFARWCENGKKQSVQVDKVLDFIDVSCGNGTGVVTKVIHNIEKCKS